ncbi:MAG: G5 domain-containing protein [Anaerolineae bacterium]
MNKKTLSGFRQGRWAGLGWLAGWVLLPLILAACQQSTGQSQIFIEVDHGRRDLTTEVLTVREALAVAGIELGELDRVEPDLYVQIEPGMTIRVTRVEEELEVERVIVPFKRQTVVNEALPVGERRLVQLGVNGEDEITYRRIIEDGLEVERREISRVPVTEPVDEIIVVGVESEGLTSVPVEGTITYLSGGNAWLIRDTSNARRPLTTEGDLDGRVFSLSPDGRRLIYSRRLEGDVEAPLNQLWMVSTTLVGAQPISLPVRSVLYAEWSPIITETRIIYSTAERVASPPGWRANNDLWLLDVAGWEKDPETEPEEVLPPNALGVYPWWGTTFKWSPAGGQVAYARADQVGVIDLARGRRRPLLNYPPLQTFSEWVWVPTISWSPDGNFLAAVGHGSPLGDEPPEESPVFDLWLLAVDGAFQAKIANQVGMWSGPSWGESAIVFGQAMRPLASVDSRYALSLVDNDGSNARTVFPLGEEPGVELPQIVWAPDGGRILFVYNGNLYLMELNGTPPQQLTTDGQGSRPQWVGPPPLIEPAVLTGTTSITATPGITVTAQPTLLATPEDATTIRQTTTPTATIQPRPTITATTSP